MRTELFSPTEQKILKILGEKTMTTRQIAERLYKDEEKLSPLTTVASLVRRISAKCEYHKLPWFLNGYGLGRNGKFIFKDVR